MLLAFLRIWIVCMALATADLARAAAPDLTILWETEASEQQLAKGQIHLNLTMRSGDSRHSSQNGTTYDLTALRGLTAADLAPAPVHDVAFRFVRPAGTFACAGTVHARIGTGRCSFAPDPQFVTGLRARGIDAPKEVELYQLAVSGAELSVLDALASQGYPRPDAEQFVKLGIFRVTAGYVRDIAARGYTLPSSEGLVEFRIFEVTPAYIDELAALGPRFRNLPARTLVKLRIHKVSPSAIRRLAVLGYRDLNAATAIRFAIFKVTPEFIEELRTLGYTGISAEQLVALRVHNVTPQYVRSIARAGIARPGIDQLTRLRISGFTPSQRNAR